MVVTSSANHESTNLKKGFDLKNSSTRLLYLPISSSAKTGEIFGNMLCYFFFA